MFDKMKQLMEIKKQADSIKKELDALTMEVEEIRGIKIVVTGSQSFRSINIDESMLNAENKGRFERDLLQSMNAAMNKAQTAAARKMAQVMPQF
jgi:DNA-binding protein YbaB